MSWMVGFDPSIHPSMEPVFANTMWGPGVQLGITSTLEEPTKEFGIMQLLYKQLF